MTPGQFIAYVDEFMAAQKQLIGAYDDHDWQPGQTSVRTSIRLPLERAGVQGGEVLHITSYPNYESLRFHIAIIIEPSVCRIDYELDGVHGNNFTEIMDEVPRFADAGPCSLRDPNYITRGA